MPRFLNSKVCIITGATSGIGKCTALQLAKEGWVIGIVSRKAESGNETLKFMLDACPGAKIDLFVGDLSSQHSMRAVCSSIFQKYSKIDALIHNAGHISSVRQQTVDGIELTFAVNHLAPFLLTSLLMPLLKAASEAKIVLVTSRAEELGKISFDNLQGETSYSWIQSYCQSKLANLLFAYELSKREEKSRVSVLALHPGLTQSKLGRNLTGIFRYIPLILSPFMQKPEKAATFLTQLLKLPHSSEARYYIKNKPARSSPRSYDKELSSKLWAISETLTREIK